MKRLAWLIVAGAVFLVVLQLSVRLFAEETCQTRYAAKNQAQMNVCITENGNVVGLEGPPGYAQVLGVEGYGVCDSGSYFDLGAWNSGNWGQSVITQPKGPNTFPLTITRPTLDGKYTLTQIFNVLGAGKILEIQMQLYGSETGKLIRYVEPTGLKAGNTQNTAFVWGSYGLLLQPKKLTSGVASAIVSGGQQDPCHPSGQTGIGMMLTYPMPQGRGLKAYFDYSTLR